MGNWVAVKGKPDHHPSLPTLKLTLFLGVGSVKPNDRGNVEEGEPEAPKDDVWHQLLRKDRELKSWEDVTALSVNKVNLGMALREYIREAWGKVFFLITFFFI